MKEVILDERKTTTHSTQKARKSFAFMAPISWRVRRRERGEQPMYGALLADFSFAGEYSLSETKAAVAAPMEPPSRIPMRVVMLVKVHPMDDRDGIRCKIEDSVEFVGTQKTKSP